MKDQRKRQTGILKQKRQSIRAYSLRKAGLQLFKNASGILSNHCLMSRILMIPETGNAVV